MNDRQDCPRLGIQQASRKGIDTDFVFRFRRTPHGVLHLIECAVFCEIGPFALQSCVHFPSLRINGAIRATNRNRSIQSSSCSDDIWKGANKFKFARIKLCSMLVNDSRIGLANQCAHARFNIGQCRGECATDRDHKRRRKSDRHSDKNRAARPSEQAQTSDVPTGRDRVHDFQILLRRGHLSE